MQEGNVQDTTVLKIQMMDDDITISTPENLPDYNGQHTRIPRNAEVDGRIVPTHQIKCDHTFLPHIDRLHKRNPGQSRRQVNSSGSTKYSSIRFWNATSSFPVPSYARSTHIAAIGNWRPRTNWRIMWRWKEGIVCSVHHIKPYLSDNLSCKLTMARK